MFATEWIMRHEAKRLGRRMTRRELDVLTAAMLQAETSSDIYWIYRRLLREDSDENR